MPSIDHIMRWCTTSAPLNICPLVSNNYTSLTIFYYVDTIDLYYFTNNSANTHIAHALPHVDKPR